MARTHHSSTHVMAQPPWLPEGLTYNDVARWFGWFFTTLGLVAAGTELINSSSGKYFTIASLSAGLWLVIKANRFLPVSESTQVLIKEEGAGRVAHRMAVSKHVLLGYALGVLLSGGVVAVALTGFSGSTYLLPVSMGFLITLTIVYARVSHSEALYGIAAILGGVTFASLPPSLPTVLTVLSVGVSATYLATQQGKWSRLLALLFLAYLPFAGWLLDVNITTSESAVSTGAAIVALFVVTLSISLPFMYRKRQAEERERVRQVIAASYGAFTIILLGTAFEATQYRTLLQLAPAAMAMGAAMVAFLGYGRYSYAKYFAITGIVSLVAVSAAYLPYTGFIGMVLMLSSALLVFGLAYNSYTFRLAGMGGVAASHMLYLFNLLSLLIGGSAFPPSSDQMYLGIGFGVSLPILALAYEAMPHRGPEAHYRPALIAILWCAALSVLSLVVGIGSTGSAQSILWVCLGLAGMLGARVRSVPLLFSLAVALTAVAMSKLIFIDLFSLYT